MITPKELKDRYERGENVTALLRGESGAEHNTEQIIELAYDLQTGRYAKALCDESRRRLASAYSGELVRRVRALLRPRSLLEAGVGEATTLRGVLEHFADPDLRSYGFDLSWSRVAFGRRWLAQDGGPDTTLCTGSLFHIPFADASIDVVYTSHSIEPNGGREEPILRELVRVARRYVVLLEPGYEFASEEARARMEQHGYCRGLSECAEAIGCRVCAFELFPVSANPLNPTAILVIEKAEESEPNTHVLACPRFKTSLEEIDGQLFSPEAQVVYPVVGGIPCLRIENGIVASRYAEFAGGWTVQPEGRRTQAAT